MTAQKELLELSISALKDGLDGLGEFKNLFTEISDLFENGNDVEALQRIGDLSQALGDFANFAGSLNQNCLLWLPETQLTDLADANAKFETHINGILDEAQNRNFIEVADILRYDLPELMDNYHTIFVALTKALESTLSPS